MKRARAAFMNGMILLSLAITGIACEKHSGEMGRSSTQAATGLIGQACAAAMTEPFERIGQIEEAEGYSKVQFSGDGSAFLARKYNAATSHSDTVRVWDARTLKPLSGPLAQKGLNWSGLSADGKTAYTTNDNELLLWDVSTSKVRTAAKLTGQDRLFAGISPDGTQLLTIPDDNKHTMAVWRFGQAKATFQLPTERGPIYGAFDPTGARIVIDESWAFSLFDVATGSALCPPIPSDSDTWEDRIQFSRNGRRFVVPQSHGFTLVDAATGKITNEVQIDDQVTRVRFSVDGLKISATILHGVHHGPARIYDAATGKFDQEIGTDIGYCTVGPRAQWAFCTQFRDVGSTVMEIWDLRSRQKVQTLPFPEGHLSPDGSSLVLQPKSSVIEGWRLKQADPATQLGG